MHCIFSVIALAEVMLIECYCPQLRRISFLPGAVAKPTPAELCKALLCECGKCLHCQKLSRNARDVPH